MSKTSRIDLRERSGRSSWTVTLVVAIGVWLQDPKYRASATLMVTSDRAQIVVSPDADQTLEEGDVLVTLGQPEKLESLNE